MHKPGFIALGVKRTRAHAATGRHSYYHICLLAPAVMYLGQVVYNLVKTGRNKICKLHFHHAFVAFQA